MNRPLLEIVKERKSVRTFDGNKLSKQDQDLLTDYMSETENPFQIPVQFVFLDGAEHGLSSPVLSGDTLYIAGIVEKKPYADVAFGYAFEKLVLYAWSIGIGTVWIGGTMNREQFEKAAGLSEGYMMPCISPLGYPAKKRSLKESMMRKGVKADTRIPAEQLFFKDSWGQPLSIPAEMKDIFEMVRWAPSAVNKQPWRVVEKDGVYHFYEKKDKGYVNESTGDLQKIDVGIALCHFVMGLKESGKQPAVQVEDPGISVPEKVEYIASISF
ncbi:MAG: nitroreductase family protein [Parasporobacterium sp.]|nr:nitroreductase family protein [Parasporobacterium sp.]